MTRSSTAALASLVIGAAVFTTAVIRSVSRPAPRPSPPAAATAVTPESEARSRRRVVLESSPRERAAQARRRLATTPWTVVLLGPGDVPLRNAAVAIDDEEDEHHASTDENGVAVLPWHMDRASIKIELNGHLPLSWQTLTARYTVIRLPDLVGIRIRYRDALTGEVLRGGGVRTTPRFVEPHDLTRDGDGFVMSPAAYERNSYDGASFALSPPAGYRAKDVEYLGAITSPLADIIVFDIPVWPTGDVLVRVTDAFGAPAPDVVVAPVTLSGFASYGEPTRTDADGHALFQDVPMVPDETLTIDAEATDGRFVIVKSASIAPNQRAMDVSAQLPAAATVRPGRRRSCGGSSGLPHTKYDDMPTGGDTSIDVQVLLRDGRPARGVTVCAFGDWDPVVESWGEWKSEECVTDGEGRAHLRGIHGTVRRLVASARGLSPIAAEYTGEGNLTLREPDGSELRVRVVTRDGHPVASAEIDARCSDYALDLYWGYSEVVKGVQTGTLLTDAEGVFVLRHLPENCSVTVTARQGSRRSRERAEPGGPLTILLD